MSSFYESFQRTKKGTKSPHPVLVNNTIILLSVYYSYIINCLNLGLLEIDNITISMNSIPIFLYFGIPNLKNHYTVGSRKML